MLCLMDDKNFWSYPTQEEYDRCLMATLQQIETAGVTLNQGKCEFRRTELKYLGHIVSKDGIHADPDKTVALVNMKPPTKCFRAV